MRPHYNDIFRRVRLVNVPTGLCLFNKDVLPVLAIEVVIIRIVSPYGYKM